MIFTLAGWCIIGLGIAWIVTAVCCAAQASELDNHKADTAEELDALRAQVEKLAANQDHMLTAWTQPVRPRPAPAKRIVEPKTDPLIPVQSGGPATVPTQAIIDSEHVELIEVEGRQYERRDIGGYSFNFKPQP